MSFKSSGPFTRPDRVKPPSFPPPPNPASPLPKPPSTNHHHNNHKRTPSSTSTHSSTSTTPSLPFHDAHFPPSIEATMLSTSNTLKSTANTQFAAADYSSAISTYDKAIAELPSYFDYELAVLQSNIAACYVKLGEWKEVVECCERGLEGLERVWGSREGAERRRRGEREKRKKEEREKEKKEKKKEKKREGEGESESEEGKRTRKGLESDSDSDDDESSNTQQNKANGTKTKLDTVADDDDDDDGQVVELPFDASDSELQQQLHQLNLTDTRKRDVTRIRTKLLLRRARAKSSLLPPTWSSLGGALEDYQLLSTTKDYFDALPISDRNTVRMALAELPGRVNEAKDREMGEMMGKLKEVGNGVLGLFGLNTDMFKMTQGADGGWSLNVDGGAGRTGA